MLQQLWRTLLVNQCLHCTPAWNCCPHGFAASQQPVLTNRCLDQRSPVSTQQRQKGAGNHHVGLLSKRHPRPVSPAVSPCLPVLESAAANRTPTWRWVHQPQLLWHSHVGSKTQITRSGSFERCSVARSNVMPQIRLKLQQDIDM